MNKPTGNTGTTSPGQRDIPGETHTAGQGPYKGPVRPGGVCVRETPALESVPVPVVSVYSIDNPWWQRMANRLREAGGQHRPSTVATDATILAEQYAVDLARETAELLSEPVASPF